MDKCPICRINDADKKNVHLIPWFLIKNCITQRGSGERDMELSFSIEPQSFTKMYAGRSVLPETVEEFGELHDLQKEKENPYSRGNLICTECEEKLSRLEAIFASQFTDKKLRNAFQSKLDKLNGHSIVIDKKYNASLYELLIQSIYYRCSIGRFNGFKLNPEIQNKIEENLRKAFSIEGFKKIKANEKIDYPYKFPILTTSFFIPEGEDKTKNFIVVNNSRFPYFIMAGKWMFQLFEATKHLKSTVEWLYGLQSELKPSKTYNLVKNNSHIILLEEEAGKSISKNLLDFFTQKGIIGVKKTIRDLHVHIFGTKPDINIAQYIFQQYFVHLDEGKTEFDSMVHAFFDLKKLS
jgi:hypothetical protein